MKKLKFSERLQELRLEKGLSQKELSKKLGVNQTAVSKWESDQRQTDFQTLILLAEFFEVSTDYLLGLED